MVNRDFLRIIRTTRLSHLLERRCFLYGYYNSEQYLIQVKICTAVDKEKGDLRTSKIEHQLCDEKPTNAEIAVFLWRKQLIFETRCGIMTTMVKCLNYNYV